MMHRFSKRTLFFLLLLALVFAALIPSVPAEDDEDVEIVLVRRATREPAVQVTPPALTTPPPTPVPVDSATQTLTVTAVGDVTIGRNVQHSGASIFETELKKQKNDINFIFRNVKDIFEADDLTIANFEGVLADRYTIPAKKKNNDYLFLAPVSYVSVLPDNSVEAVTMENNHVGDFGEDGIASTIAAMESAGVVWSNAGHMGVYEVKGVRIAMLAYQTLNQPITSSELRDVVAGDIAAAKQTCQIVIVSFHWGNELDYYPQSNQIMLGRAAVDAGADLVLGHHSHRINPIEYYNGKYIVYSLANCSFAGNSKPSDMNTFIFQIRFTVNEGNIVGNAFRIIPCRISSRKNTNDFAITPLTDLSTINTVISTLNKSAKNAKGLTYAVTSYPLDWE